MMADLGNERECEDAVRRWLEAEPLWQRALGELRASGRRVYLVGGSVRDALRGQLGGDMDLAVDEEAIALGRWLGDRLHGAFYPMDREHDVARIVFPRTGRAYHIDLAGLRGKTILDDLAARDFTVNAMGVALAEELGPLLDPTGGRADLRQGVLRMAYPRALDDDPVRMLRALRLSASLGLRLEPETRAQIQAQCAAIERVSPERVRDELLAILVLGDATPLRQAAELGLLPLALPIPDEASALAGIRWVEALHAWLLEGGAGPYRDGLGELWAASMVEGRARGALAALAALVAGAPLAERQRLGARLRLSGREEIHLGGALAAQEDEVWAAGRDPGPVEAHRYYRRYGEAGVDGAALAACRPGASPAHVRRASYLLWVWFDAHDRIVAPPRLLQGHDLLREYGLAPGPRIGALLHALAEAQAAGRVSTGAQARAYIRELVARDSSEGNYV